MNIKIVNPEPLLTKEQKANWLKALRSGKYIQAKNTLIENKGLDSEKHCCLGVLNNISDEKYPDWDDVHVSCTFKVNNQKGLPISMINDDHNFPEKRDYSNVIPFIELLPTID